MHDHYLRSKCLVKLYFALPFFFKKEALFVRMEGVYDTTDFDQPHAEGNMCVK
jgi:hypothetical protein